MGTPNPKPLTGPQLVAAGFGTPAKTTLRGRPNTNSGSGSKPKKRKSNGNQS